MINARNAKRLRFVVLRAHDPERAKELAETLTSKMTPAEVNAIIHKALGGRAQVMGFSKPGSKALFDRDGTPLGASIEPGDVLNTIEEFERGQRIGAYVKEDTHAARP